MKLRDRNGKFIITKSINKCELTTCFTNTKTKYCSRKCYWISKIEQPSKINWTPEMRLKMSQAYTGKGNPNYGKPAWSRGKKRWEISGEKHYNWKGGSCVVNGYKVIQNNYETAGQKKSEHRKIVEEYLGRELLSSEIIHHINHNKIDNRIENLMIVSRREHIKIHPPIKQADQVGRELGI